MMLFLYGQCFAINFEKDTSYIVQFERPYNIQFNTWLNGYVFFINPSLFSVDKTQIRIAPNLSWQTGASLGLKNITLSLGFQVPGTESDPERYGKTDYFDFSGGYYPSYIGGEIYARKFAGVYSNIGANKQARIRSDVIINAYGLNIFYFSNHKKFSFRSSISLAEYQKKSSGSFVLLGNLGFKSIMGDSTIIPRTLGGNENYGDLEFLKGIQIYHFNFKPGYAYNLISKNQKWFLSPGVFIGAGLSKYNIYSKIKNTDGFSFDLDLHSKFSIGFNDPKYFWNFYFMYDSSINQFRESNSVGTHSTSFGFNLGYRFQKFIPTIEWL